jgi:hypothetical protein
MNKLLIVTGSLLAAGSAFAEFSAHALNVDAGVKFNTADVYEGRRRLDQSFAPNIEIGLPFLDDAASLYAGVGAALGVNSDKSSGRNEVAPYVGFSYDITEMFTFDAGYALRSLDKKPVMGYVRDGNTYFSGIFLVPQNGVVNIWDPARGADAVTAVDATDTAAVVAALEGAVIGQYQSVPQAVAALNANGYAALEPVISGPNRAPVMLEGKKQSHEIYAGVMVDVLLNPAIYFSYDFTQKKVNVNGAVNHVFDLSSCGVTGFAIDLGCKVGYSRAKKPYGISCDTKVDFIDMDITADVVNPVVVYKDLLDKTCWFYAGANADLVYSLNENAKARAGIALSYNNAAKDSWINERNHKKHNVWFSSAVEFSF